MIHVLILTILILLILLFREVHRFAQRYTSPNRVMCYYCSNSFLQQEVESIGSYTYCLQHGYFRKYTCGQLASDDLWRVTFYRSNVLRIPLQKPEKIWQEHYRRLSANAQRLWRIAKETIDARLHR